MCGSSPYRIGYRTSVFQFGIRVKVKVRVSIASYDAVLLIETRQAIRRKVVSRHWSTVLVRYLCHIRTIWCVRDTSTMKVGLRRMYSFVRYGTGTVHYSMLFSTGIL